MAQRVKRTYDATRRLADAERTRRHIVDVATPLFVASGYAAASMRQIADAAEVSLQTLYNAFGSKYGLFSTVMDVVVAGDHEPVALADRAQARAIDTVERADELIRAAVELATPVLVRLNVIYPTLRAAASSDPQVAAGYQQFVIDARYQPNRQAAGRLAALGALPPGVDETHAADVMWTVLSPDTFHLLVTHRGWTADEYAAWATNTLLTTLVAAPSRGRSRTRRA